MINTAYVKEHMEVIGADGKHVGKVDKVLGDQIELAKFDLGSGLKHHLVPVSWVDQVANDKVRLTMTAEAAKHAWMDKTAH